MAETAKQGLAKRRTPTEDEITEIAELNALCKEYDGSPLRIPIEALRQRPGTEIGDFLYYEQGRLVGYLYVDSWGQKEKEITGMVAPEFRRRGIFLQLFAAACEEARTRGVEVLTLVCEHKSHAGHAFARAIKARESFSEHEMVLGLFIDRQQFDPQFHMRQATSEDKVAIITIIATDMGGDENAARQLVETFYTASDQQIYLSTLAGKPLGCLRLDYRSEAVGIYGFVVRPEFRRRGYGRQMLEQIIRQVKNETDRLIMLEVETDNHHALALYHSCGFEITATYDYFDHALSS